MFGKLGSEAFKATEATSSALGKIINNISNMKTIGFKKGEVTFAEALNGEIIKHEGKDFSQGPLRRTAEPFDLAIEGKGFFEVELPSGQRAYTRVGMLHLSNDAELVTQEGYRILPLIEQTKLSDKKVIKSDPGKETQAGEFKLEAMNLKVSTPKLIVPTHLTPEITKDGTVYGTNQATGEKAKLGRIGLVTFNNPQGLESLGKGYYLETNVSGKPLEIASGPNASTRVRQGFIEFSNVDVAQEFMELTQIKTLITAQIKVLKVIDKIYENVHFTISRAV